MRDQTLEAVPRSPVCRAEIAENGHNSRVSPEIKEGILCTTDCLAEREGFEPSVQVLARTTV